MADIGRDWRSKYPTTEQQAEFFLLKFHEVSRDAVFALKKQFARFDARSRGELEVCTYLMCGCMDLMCGCMDLMCRCMGLMCGCMDLMCGCMDLMCGCMDA